MLGLDIFYGRFEVIESCLGIVSIYSPFYAMSGDLVVLGTPPRVWLRGSSNPMISLPLLPFQEVHHNPHNRISCVHVLM